ncbi:MAG: hypothetical protein LW809_08015 [Vampirovibrionales bacterium]|jgi:hypothetical protein|nr:hypothetical protein [Vampirovibrionales bacterium]
MNPEMLYQLLTAQLASQPNLAEIQTPAPCPESWPLLLSELVFERKRMTGFYVTDAQENRVFCRCSMVDVYEKVIALGEGAIIHLRGASPVYLKALNAYGLDVEQVLKLKEYADEVKSLQKKLAKRELRLRQQMEKEGIFKDESPSI